MRVRIVAVGRERDEAVERIVARYTRRGTWPVEMRIVEAKKGLAGDALKRAEADLLLAAVPEGAAVLALDERGELPDSVAFATRLGHWRDAGRRDLAVLIGGADGHDASVLARADWQVSLGRLTWPHMLVRAMIAEQIYRAQTILSGHPYHRA
ncbi:MAG: 23S rRNA (pseudouridine(1915)-N(3))-methyltransferase RlmH [Azospirillaceae bacterium]